VLPESSGGEIVLRNKAKSGNVVPPRLRLKSYYFHNNLVATRFCNKNATQRNLNPQATVDHPTFPSGMLATPGLEEELNTAMW